MYHPIKPYKTINLQFPLFPAPLAFLHLPDPLPRFGDDVKAPETAAAADRAVAVAAIAGAAGAKVAGVVLAKRGSSKEHAPETRTKKWTEGSIWSLILRYIHVLVFGFFWISSDFFGFIWPNGFHWWMDAANLKRW